MHRVQLARAVWGLQRGSGWIRRFGCHGQGYKNGRCTCRFCAKLYSIFASVVAKSFTTTSFKYSCPSPAMGQRASTLETCRERMADKNYSADNCTIEFDSSGNVVSFAGIGHGEFEADPDIAGAGVSDTNPTLTQGQRSCSDDSTKNKQIVGAFMALSVIVCGVGLILATISVSTLLLSRMKK